MPQNASKLESRMVQAAEAALENQKFVSPIDVLLGMGRLTPSHIEQWRHGRIDYLEQLVQGNLHKIADILHTFRQWALAKGLQPSETRYMRHGHGGNQELRFSASGNPEMERLYRTHYISRELSAAKRQKLEEKSSRPPQPVVFDNLRRSQCSECGVKIDKGEFLYMDAGQPLCLACGGFGDLEFLPAGDTALTRRAGRYGTRSAVVVRFSRSRGRYERQGLLVEPEALEKAEQECAGDAAQRAQARVRNAAARQKQDRDLAARMADRIRQLFPRCPPEEARAMALHTAQRGSGRIGRTAAGQALDDRALRLAVVAAIRHRHTSYDELLTGGLDRGLARQRVEARVEQVLAAWGPGPEPGPEGPSDGTPPPE
ncbi:MAG: DUF2293 domain-containing protein [Bryobacteraceae bacterium]